MNAGKLPRRATDGSTTTSPRSRRGPRSSAARGARRRRSSSASATASRSPARSRRRRRSCSTCCFAVEPKARVFAIDTHYLFPETYELWREVEQRYDTKIEVFEGPSAEELTATHGEKLWERKPDLYLAVAKVEPLVRALGDLDCWITGIRRDQSPTRATAPKLGWDAAHELWKANPLADWSDDDCWTYIRERGLPYNALHDRGYASIGDTHSTLPGAGREGRWAGSDRTECGLHPRLMQRHARPPLPPRRARGGGDPHHARARGRARAAGAALLRRQGLDRAAAARREGVPAGQVPVPGHARRHGPQLPRGDRVPRPPRRRARRDADRRLGAGVDRQRAASSRRPARAPRGTSSRRRRCSTRSRSTASTPRSAARAATRSAPARRSGSSASATTSASGTRARSGPSSGTSTTRASAAASTCASSRSRTGPSSTSGSTSPASSSSCRRSTSRTSARCSGATGCSTRPASSSSGWTARSRSPPRSASARSAT